MMTTAYQIYWEAPSVNAFQERHIMGAAETRREALEEIDHLCKTRPEFLPVGYGITVIHSHGNAYELCKEQVGKIL
jgi:hypothetical protein